ncbi:invasion associated locus B family protein [Roseovarius sp. 2305UL8-3]|uniref:invasion associated locus B family protein n=1 Tax=Roseovarius conchicola TaxID=3121636 RepID=UPI00352828A5
MPKLLYTLPFLAALAFDAPAYAQDDTTTDQAEATEAAETTDAAEAEAEATTEDNATEDGEADAADTGLDMGQPVQEDPTYVKETYGDWELKCFRSEAEEDPCQMFQLLREDAGNPVAEFSIFRLPEGAQAAAGATIVVPLGTMLTEELKITVDGGRAKSYSYRFCSLVGCYAQIGLTAEDIEAFKRGVEATLQIVPAQAPDQKVNIKASLSGFTAAFENASVLEN